MSLIKDFFKNAPKWHKASVAAITGLSAVWGAYAAADFSSRDAAFASAVAIGQAIVVYLVPNKKDVSEDVVKEVSALYEQYKQLEAIFHSQLPVLLPALVAPGVVADETAQPIKPQGPGGDLNPGRVDV
jgi:hypothetical protein